MSIFVYPKYADICKLVKMLVHVLVFEFVYYKVYDLIPQTT